MDKIIDFCQQNGIVMKVKYIPETDFIHFKFYEGYHGRNHVLLRHISGDQWSLATDDRRKAMFKEILDKLKETYSTEKE